MWRSALAAAAAAGRTLSPWLATLALAISACAGGLEQIEGPPEDVPDPPEVVAGERLLRETRFAQYFAAHSGGDVNAILERGDPVTDAIVSPAGPLPGPYRGLAMNCAGCHLVDELADVPGGGVRTYADLARHSPIPARDDGRETTPRNSPSLVNASLERPGPLLLHFDAEFEGDEELVIGTFTGRNFGWLPDEQAAAIAHVARVIREDDGRGDLASAYGALSYATLLRGTARSIPPELRLPEAYRVDVAQAPDRAVLDAASRLVSAYLRGLVFSRDAGGEFDGSPYDRFLAVNGLPRAPAPGESPADYGDRLLALLDGLSSPRFVSAQDGALSLHAHPFVFGPQELAGFRIFLRRADRPAGAGRTSEVGHCVSCHQLPVFTDFGFHNVGTAQEEYDLVFGAGAFEALEIPDLATRNLDPERWLPPSPAFPRAAGPFLSVVSAERPGATDLGLWNVFANPAVPSPQASLRALLCGDGEAGVCPDDATLLAGTVAGFKTPGLRDLGQSAPYMHTGLHASLEEVVDHYVRFGALARAGQVRNPDAELASVRIDPRDVAPLAAFLRGLDEDYD